jgi:hypothetical protein
LSTYLYSKWKNSDPEDPVELYSELDPARWETRKVEIFRDGRMGYASQTQSAGDTRLAIVPIPSLGEIASQVEFEVKTIDGREFESVWKRATQ